MRSNINTIKYLAMLSAVLLLITYSISLNVENRWIFLDTPLLLNSFPFAIAGGSFASILVVLACELQKYQSIKRQIKNYMFGLLFSLYEQVTIIHYNSKRQLNYVSAPVPNNRIDEIANRGKMCLTSLASIEHITFCKNNSIEKQLIQYKGDSGTRIHLFLQDSVFLKMVLSFVEKSLSVIDKEIKKRYHWSELKRNVICFEEKYVSASLDNVLKSPTVQFE